MDRRRDRVPTPAISLVGITKARDRTRQYLQLVVHILTGGTRFVTRVSWRKLGFPSRRSPDRENRKVSFGSKTGFQFVDPRCMVLHIRSYQTSSGPTNFSRLGTPVTEGVSPLPVGPW